MIIKEIENTLKKDLEKKTAHDGRRPPAQQAGCGLRREAHIRVHVLGASHINQINGFPETTEWRWGRWREQLVVRQSGALMGSGPNHRGSRSSHGAGYGSGTFLAPESPGLMLVASNLCARERALEGRDRPLLALGTPMLDETSSLP